MQVDPIEPTLKAPGTERLKLKRDKPLSNFALKINLRRYNMEELVAESSAKARGIEAGAHTRPPFTST